jgi:protein-tyrosine phosphatase
MEVAVQMARIAEEDGITTIVSTPHFRPNDENTDLVAIHERIYAGVEMLNHELKERGIAVEVLNGAEIAMSEKLPELADRDLLPTLGDGKHILVELPIATWAAYAEQVLFELQVRGYTPVIAHFERLASAPVREIKPEDLVARGMKIQVNCESLQGKRGRDVAKLATRLLKQGLVHALGSDAHDPVDAPPLLTPCRRAVERAGGRGTFERLTGASAAEIVGRG